MAPRANRVRQRYQARLNLHDGMGALWEWLMSIPEGSRAHELVCAANLGVQVSRGAMQGVLVAAGPPAVLQRSAAVAAPPAQPDVGPGPRSLDPVGAASASCAMAGWDLGSSFDSVAPMEGIQGNAD